MRGATLNGAVKDCTVGQCAGVTGDNSVRGLSFGTCAFGQDLLLQTQSSRGHLRRAAFAVQLILLNLPPLRLVIIRQFAFFAVEVLGL